MARLLGERRRDHQVVRVLDQRAERHGPSAAGGHVLRCHVRVMGDDPHAERVRPGRDRLPSTGTRRGPVPLQARPGPRRLPGPCDGTPLGAADRLLVRTLDSTRGLIYRGHKQYTNFCIPKSCRTGMAAAVLPGPDGRSVTECRRAEGSRMAVGAVDVTYRGVFQKNLAGVITKELVRAARREGKIGGTVQRYGDSPERNVIPAKQFAVIADDADALRVEMTKYEPENVLVICVMDDTLTKGVESWAWYGVRPVNLNLAPGGTLMVISRRSPEELLRLIPRRTYPWNLAILPGEPSFGGLWVYNDDGTDYRTMGAVSRVTGGLVALDSLLAQAGGRED